MRHACRVLGVSESGYYNWKGRPDPPRALSFWGRMQVELLNRRRWKTRVELANAIHDYIELLHNTRRHSALGMLTPTEYEDLHNATQQAA